MALGNESNKEPRDIPAEIPMDRIQLVGDHALANAAEWDVTGPDGSRESIIDAYDRGFLGGTALTESADAALYRPNRRQSF